MTVPGAEHHAAALLQLLRTLAQNPRLAAELQRAERQFGAPALATAAGQCRFAEWFVLERDSEVLGAVPAQLPDHAEACSAFDGSLAGAFLVTSLAPTAALVRDLQDDGMLELRVPQGSLQPGDLLVGRLFATEGGWLPSVAAGVFRPGTAIGEAFRADLARLELDRRLQQVELEHLLLRRADQGPSPTAPAQPASLHPERLEAELDQLLQKGGSSASATAISAQLAAAMRPGAVIGPLLESLAFDTEVDLDAARRLLLELWQSLHADGAAAAEPMAVPPGLSLGEQLVHRLEAGLAAQQDPEELFADLERMAGIDDDEEEGDAGVDPGGDLGPLVQEFLWETGAGDDSAIARTLQTLVQLQENAALPRPDLEQVTAKDLERLLLHLYLGASPTGRHAAVTTAHAQLQEFYAWAAVTLEQPELLGHVAAEGLPLLAQSARLGAASAALSTPPAPGLRPLVLEVEDTGSDGFGVADDDGNHHWLTCSGAAAALIQVGDLVVAALAGKGSGQTLQGPVVVLPEFARSFLE
jgi:hypothetical protein